MSCGCRRELWTLATLPIVAVPLVTLDPFVIVGAFLVIPLVMRSVWATGRLT